MNRLKARVTEWETKTAGFEASALLPFIAGRTVLDVGGGNGFYSKYWKRNGLDPTVLDCCICISAMRSMDRAGVKYVLEDFYRYGTENRFDTVVALHSVEVTGALQKELEHARMRVISTVMLPINIEEWQNSSKKYLSWINKVIGVAAANRNSLDAYFVLLDKYSKVLGRLSPEEVKREWEGKSMNILNDDWNLVLIVDKRDPDAKVLFPSSFIRQAKGANYGYG